MVGVVKKFMNAGLVPDYSTSTEYMKNMNAVCTVQALSNLMKLAEIISDSYARRKYESPALQCYIQGRIDGVNEIYQYIQDVATAIEENFVE
ncbi:hypothetical protein [Escherichia coli]|uniref:hypothetical protein n=1 Tax=Escherichia coli TaxID=562 RepID=UPI000A19BB38|nr:hypothetical protein [Escherichia coli]